MKLCIFGFGKFTLTSLSNSLGELKTAVNLQFLTINDLYYNLMTSFYISQVLNVVCFMLVTRLHTMCEDIFRNMIEFLREDSLE